MHVPLRIGTRGSQLALWQARTVARHARGTRGSRPNWSSSGRRAIGCRRRRCRKSAASGCSSRKLRTRCCATRSTSPSTAPRTCRRCCRTASGSPRRCRARTRATSSFCRAGHRRGMPLPCSPGSDRGHAWAPAASAGSRSWPALIPGAVVRANPRERRYPAAQARSGRVRCARPGRGGPAPARIRRPDLGRDSGRPAAYRPRGRGSSRWRLGATTTAAGARRSRQRSHGGAALDAERAVVAALGGGCQLPLGALAVVRGGDAASCTPSSARRTALACSRPRVRAESAVGRQPMAPAGRGRSTRRRTARRGRRRSILDTIRRVDGPIEGSKRR